MTRSELVEALAAKFPQLTLADAKAATDQIIEALTDALADAGRIEIRGFGAFSVTYREPRTGRNPKTGVKVPVPAKYIPHFKPGKEMRVRVDGET